MQPPLFVRTLTAVERQQLQAGLRSASAFTLRRCQILLASAAGQTTPTIARHLGCTSPSVRNAIHAFHAEGLACLQEKSSRPHSARPLLDAVFDEPLRDLLHRSPRTFFFSAASLFNSCSRLRMLSSVAAISLVNRSVAGSSPLA